MNSKSTAATGAPKAKSKANPLHQIASSLRALRERHQRRHQPSGFHFAFADRVDLLDPVRWDALTREQTLFLRRDVLRVIEEHGPTNIVPRYAMVFSGSEPIAAIAAQIVSVTGEHLRPAAGTTNGREESRARRLLQRALKPAAQVAAAGLRERMLVAGNLLSWGFHGVALSPKIPASEIWPGVAEALYRIRRAERLTGQTDFVMVKDLTEAQVGQESLRSFSYRPLETEPNMVLAIDPAWRGYDDYLAALDAKYRRNSKDQLKKLTNAGCSIESFASPDQLAAHAPRIHELYKAVQGNAAVRLVTLGENFLPALAGALGEHFRCTVIRRADQILGFVTSLRDGETAIAYYIGFDRAAAAEGLPIYLRLLHATIGDAIQWRCRSLSLGRTALEPKAALGGRPQPMSVWMRHRVPAMNWLLRGVMGAIPHAEVPERNPFKTAAPSPRPSTA